MNDRRSQAHQGRRRHGLRKLLALGSAGLAIAAVLGVSIASAWLLRRLAEEQAFARVELAAQAAADAVIRAEERTNASARLLAERPTLARLVASGDSSGVVDFLTRYRDTGGLARCVVIASGGLYESREETGSSAHTASLVEATGVRFVAHGETLEIVASAPLALGERGSVMVTRVLDGGFAAQLSEHVALGIRIAPASPGEAAVEKGAYRARTREAYRVTHVLRATNGGPVAGVVEASLPRETIDASVRRLLGALLAAAVLAAAAAAVAGVLMGRSLARPIDELAESARRIGQGDLTTPIARMPGEETGRLAATMEEMRRQLHHLTVELRRRESEAQVLLEGIVEGVFAVDAERRIRYLNSQAAALLGLPAGEALGRFCGDVLRPQPANGERPCASHCPIVHARSLGKTRAVERLQGRGGRPRTVVITSAAPTEGQQVQLLRDETDVEGARRARDAILANVSHEFKTPLSSQLASLELLRDSLPDEADPGVDALVLSLERSAIRLTQLVDNLLESVRLESGEDSIRTKPVALEEVIEEAVEMTAPLLRQREQRVVNELPVPLPPIVGDAPRLRQVFVNLLANAAKYAPEGSAVRLGGEIRAGSILVWVDDEGPGLPAGAEGSVFNRFYRSPGSEPDAGGMGLGLWIVKSVVERHGGVIEAQRLPGTGTRFVVTLPLREDA